MARLLICISCAALTRGNGAGGVRASERWRDWEASFTDEAPGDAPESQRAAHFAEGDVILDGTGQDAVFRYVGRSTEPEPEYDRLQFNPARAVCTRQMSCILDPMVPGGSCKGEHNATLPEAHKYDAANHRRKLPFCPIAPELERWLPETAPFPSRNGTCAVVGSSGILRFRPQGIAIDSHDYVIRVNSNPHFGKFAKMAGSRGDLDFLNTPMLDDWGKSLSFNCNTSERCAQVPIAASPCERSKRLWHHFLKEDSKELDPQLPAFIAIHSAAFVDYGAPPDPSDAMALQQCAFGPEFTIANDDFPRLLVRQQALARHLGNSAQNEGRLRLVSNSVGLELKEFCLRETRGPHVAPVQGALECNRFMGGLYAVFLSLHICEETHLYGFRMTRFNSAEDASQHRSGIPYNYYQPFINGKDQWQDESHYKYHSFDVNDYILNRLVEQGHVQLHI